MARSVALVLALLVAALLVPAPTPALAGDVFPEIILERFTTYGLPLREVQLFNEFTDPNSLLGRPGQYYAKAAWTDVRGLRTAHGTIELFRSPADFELRLAYLEQFTAIPLFAEYMFARWPVIMRLEHTLTPGEAQSYDFQLGEILRITAER